MGSNIREFVRLDGDTARAVAVLDDERLKAGPREGVSVGQCASRGLYPSLREVEFFGIAPEGVREGSASRC